MKVLGLIEVNEDVVSKKYVDEKINSIEKIKNQKDNSLLKFWVGRESENPPTDNNTLVFILK